MISTEKLYSSELQVLEMKERYSFCLKSPITPANRKQKKGKIPKPILNYFCQWASCSVKSMVFIEYMVNFFNPPLQSRIITCHLQFFGYRNFVFSPIASFFILFCRTKRVTSKHNLWKDERNNLQNKLESSSQRQDQWYSDRIWSESDNAFYYTHCKIRVHSVSSTKHNRHIYRFNWSFIVLCLQSWSACLHFCWPRSLW